MRDLNDSSGEFVGTASVSVLLIAGAAERLQLPFLHHSCRNDDGVGDDDEAEYIEVHRKSKWGPQEFCACDGPAGPECAVSSDARFPASSGGEVYRRVCTFLRHFTAEVIPSFTDGTWIILPAIAYDEEGEGELFLSFSLPAEKVGEREVREAMRSAFACHELLYAALSMVYWGSSSPEDALKRAVLESLPEHFHGTA